MAVVQRMQIGNTKIEIDDQYCVKTQEEVDAILERIGVMAYEALNAKYIREQQEREKAQINGTR